LYSQKIHHHPDSADKNFIPVSRRELIKTLIQKTTLEQHHATRLPVVFELLQTIYHARYHRYYLSLKAAYRPFNPDRDVHTRRHWSEKEKRCRQKKLFREVSAILQKANYEELDETKINESLNNEMSRGLSIGVELDDYQQVLIYARGDGLIKTYKRDWKSLFLKKVDVELPVYRRLNMLFRFRSPDDLYAILKSKGLNRFDLWLHMRRHRRLMQGETSDDYIFLRQFRDIPRSDLEMLFPNSTLRFTLLDKIKLAATGGAGTVGGIMAFLSKIALAVKPLTILLALIGFGSVLGRQVKNILYQQTHYKMVLSRSLYTHSLDINMGVIATLLDQALDEDVKEAVLAYAILLKAGNGGLMANTVKQQCEQFMKSHFDLTLNFEVSDALAKLRKDGLIDYTGDYKKQHYVAITPEKACSNMEQHWYDLYSATESLSQLEQQDSY
jgi:hypothetical protein